MINLALSIQSNLYYELIAKRLKSEEDIYVVGRPTNEEQIISLVYQFQVDVIFVDPFFWNFNISNLLEKIDKIDSSVGFVTLFHSDDKENLVEALSSGIEGCLSVNSSYTDLINAIKTVKEGGIWADNEVLTFALRKFMKKGEKPLKQLTENLTRREVEISELILDGLSNKAIANKLYISEKTVKTHISHIFRKLGIKHRYQLNTNFFDSLKSKSIRKY